MSVLALTNTADTTLKVVTNHIKQQLADSQLQAIDFSDTATVAPAKKSNLEAVKPLAQKFTITFSYQQQLHRTKVNVAGSNYGTPVYKVALSSRLSEMARVCWLQNTAQGWVVLLGGDLDPRLTKAIISAIEDQQ